MKLYFLILYAICLFCTESSYAQTSKPVKTVSMEEVVISAEAQRTGVVNKKVRTGRVHIIVNTVSTVPDTTLPQPKGTEAHYFAAVYPPVFATKFPPADTVPIVLRSAELKLQKYDSSEFSLMLVIFSTCDGDTLWKSVNLDKYEIKHNRLHVDLQQENIVLCPHEFYLGYGLSQKLPGREIRYKMFSTDKGEGAFLVWKGGKILIQEGKGFPYIFPFKLSYSEY